MSPSPALQVEELTVRYGAVAAVLDVTLSVEAGHITGLIGPNGAGKTSLIDAITGFTTPTSGRVTLSGADIGRQRPSTRARNGLARTFQSLELFDDLTVRENVLVAAHTPDLWSTITDLFWFKRHASPEVDEVLQLLQLADVSDRRPAELSNGQRHLVAMARALVAGPRLLLLDEPAAGLDPAETAQLGQTLRAIREQGIAVLLVDHDMELVLDVCDVVHVLDQGALIASGPPATVRRDPVVIDAYLGTGVQS